MTLNAEKGLFTKCSHKEMGFCCFDEARRSPAGRDLRYAKTICGGVPAKGEWSAVLVSPRRGERQACNVVDRCQGTRLFRGWCCEISWCDELLYDANDIKREETGYRLHQSI